MSSRARSRAGIAFQVGESGGEAVGAVLRRDAPELPDGVLQPGGQGGEALAAEDHLGVLPDRIDQGEMVDQVGEQRPGDGHRQIARPAVPISVRNRTCPAVPADGSAGR